VQPVLNLCALANYEMTQRSNPALSKLLTGKVFPDCLTKIGRERSAFHHGQEPCAPTKAEYICADQPVTSFFACDKAADHTFRFADHPPQKYQTQDTSVLRLQNDRMRRWEIPPIGWIVSHFLFWG